MYGEQYQTKLAEAKAAIPKEEIGIVGMFRLKIREPDGEIVGDSGWNSNQVVNLGFNQYLVSTLGGIAGSKVITHVMLGSGGAPAAGDTVLAGEVEVRQAGTFATTTGSKTLDIRATFASSNNFVTNTQNISNIGLGHTSTQGAATIFAGNTYASSSCATNQQVEVTYSVIFS
jgi:hypothetical protein